MELTNEFRVGVSVPDAWKVLTDLERIAPMLPGAQLLEVDGEEYRGVVKVKVGPIVAKYEGQATFVERDETAGRVVLRASGRDTRGQGNASATITATMAPDGDATKVSVVTDLTITGKVAQFGRGVLVEVSAKLLSQFVDALHDDLAASEVSGSSELAEAAARLATNGFGPETTAASTDIGATETSSGIRRIESTDTEPVDLLQIAGGSAMKRILPLVGLALLIVVRRLRRRASGQSRSTARPGTAPLDRMRAHRGETA